MKKIKVTYLLAGFILTFASSCTMNSKMINTAPIITQVQLTMNDLEYVGDVTGTATQSYVLGLPYGGRKYMVGSVGSGMLSGIVPTDRAVANASYDALMQKPDADFILPFAATEKTQFQFLGKKKTVTLRAKAFKIKTK